MVSNGTQVVANEAALLAGAPVHQITSNGETLYSAPDLSSLVSQPVPYVATVSGALQTQTATPRLIGGIFSTELDEDGLAVATASISGGDLLLISTETDADGQPLATSTGLVAAADVSGTDDAGDDAYYASIVAGDDGAPIGTAVLPAGAGAGAGLLGGAAAATVANRPQQAGSVQTMQGKSTAQAVSKASSPIWNNATVQRNLPPDFFDWSNSYSNVPELEPVTQAQLQQATGSMTRVQLVAAVVQLVVYGALIGVGVLALVHVL
jgi:hypothetical protein